MPRTSIATDLPSYSADRPVADPRDDQFNRAPFAAGIAKSVIALPKGECFVIGVHGPWGDGKTSVLNFTAAELGKDPSILVTWYNPWRYVNEDVMLSGFFATLARAIRVELKTRGERIAATLAKYGQFVAPADDRAAKMADLAARKAEASVEELRDRLRDGLGRSPKRIVVFIDDIDRLDADEVAALFRLIKACADFPNVVYLLAFDRDMVATALGDRLAGGGVEAGRRFLEKIIQIPLTMPSATISDLDRACKRGVQTVLDRAGIVPNDQDILRWNWAFREGVSRRLRTPRGVAQYLNAVRFAVPLLAGEVNAVDLLLVEALRVFYPAAYETIRTNQRVFIGVPVGEMEVRHGHSPGEDLLAGAKADLDARTGDALDNLVESLFPRYHVAKRGMVLGSESIKGWTKDKLVASPAYGPRFFSYAIGSSDVADRDVDAIVAAASGDKLPLVQSLLDAQVAPLKQIMLVQKLDERSPALSTVAAARVAVSLATLSDRFDEPFSLQDTNHAGVSAAELALRLCRRLDSADERLSAARQVIELSVDMWFAAAFMRRADPRHVDPAKVAPFLDPDRTRRLREAFVARFEKFALVGVTLLDLERRWKFEMLFSVALAAGRQFVHDRFVPRMRSDGIIAIRMLQCAAQPLARSGEIIPSPGALELEDFETLALLVDVDEMAKVVDEIVREDRRKGPDEWPKMKPDDRILAEFWYWYPKWKEGRGSTAPAG